MPWNSHSNAIIACPLKSWNSQNGQTKEDGGSKYFLLKSGKFPSQPADLVQIQTRLQNGLALGLMDSQHMFNLESNLNLGTKSHKNIYSQVEFHANEEKIQQAQMNINASHLTVLHPIPHRWYKSFGQD